MRKLKLIQGIFGMSVLGALGVGTSQALASTPPEWAPPGQNCAQFCTDEYGEGALPVYHQYNGYQWLCGCIP